MKKHDWMAITKEDVIKAIEKFLFESPEYPEPKSTFLIFQGKRLPAKHIRGMAYAIHYGKEISKEDYTGGKETVRFFERLGFTVDYRGKSDDTTATEIELPKGNQIKKEEIVKVNSTSKEDKIAIFLKRVTERKNGFQLTLNKVFHVCTVLKETVQFFKQLDPTVDYKGKSNDTTAKEIGPPTGNQVKKKETVKSNSTSQKDKIAISSKRVIEQKNALQLILNRVFEGDIVCEKTFPWLKTPEVLDEEYEKLVNALSSYRGDYNFAKKNVQLRCDFVCESQKIIIEYDERQHFSEARKISLNSYRQIPVLYDRDLWIKACEDISAKDNVPVNRDEGRAYYDSVRDIESHRHGYKLIRIMHGQMDFEDKNAEFELKKLLLEDSLEQSSTSLLDKDIMHREPIKIAMYLQTIEHQNPDSFEKLLKNIENMDFDILVFPEVCYVPSAISQHFYSKDILVEEDQEEAFNACVEFSKRINRAVIISSEDKFGTLFSIFANANADESIGEEKVVLYIKHTMTNYSAFDVDDYSTLANYMFQPILFKGYKIGLSICYDCNHAIFSRIWGLQDIDIIINSTGGDVTYDKWHKYNKVRAIENKCFNFVTMGGTGDTRNPKCYVFGFNPNGGEMNFVDSKGNSEISNVPGEVYVYTVDDKDIQATDEISLNQKETDNKNVDFRIPVGNIKSVLENAKEIKKNIHHIKYDNENVFILVVEGMDILRSEKVLALLYDDELKIYNNKKYIIYNKHTQLSEEFYRTKLSVVLKVRAMENFCAVILESDKYNKCYQCGMNRTSQVVQETNGYFGVDLSRTTGPEAIWKNKRGMRASWREGFEWLIQEAEDIAERR